MINGSHVIVFSNDADADRAFIQDVLGFPSVDAGGGWLIFKLPPGEVAVHPADREAKHELYLMCDDIKGTLDADNETGKKITVKSMATAAEVVKLAGSWGIYVGDKSGAESIVFSPKSLDSGSKTTFKFTTPWNCSNDGQNTTETYADFKIQLLMVTDNGTFKVDLPTHRMKMA